MKIYKVGDIAYVNYLQALLMARGKTDQILEVELKDDEPSLDEILIDIDDSYGVLFPSGDIYHYDFTEKHKHHPKDEVTGPEWHEFYAEDIKLHGIPLELLPINQELKNKIIDTINEQVQEENDAKYA